MATMTPPSKVRCCCSSSSSSAVFTMLAQKKSSLLMGGAGVGSSSSVSFSSSSSSSSWFVSSFMTLLLVVGVILSVTSMSLISHHGDAQQQFIHLQQSFLSSSSSSLSSSFGTVSSSSSSSSSSKKNRIGTSATSTTVDGIAKKDHQSKQNDGVQGSSSSSSSSSSSNNNTKRRPTKKKNPGNTIRRYLTENGTIITETVQEILDFAIVGFGKCGTTSLLRWLSQHPNVACLPLENWELMQSRPDNLIRWLYHDLPKNDNDNRATDDTNEGKATRRSYYKRCYKNPADITQTHILEYYRTYWPQTKLIVAIRHPITWFESLYNFRLSTTSHPDQFPDPTNLIGRCKGGMKHTCTEKGNFAFHLIRLGKHNKYNQNNKNSSEFQNLDRGINTTTSHHHHKTAREQQQQILSPSTVDKLYKQIVDRYVPLRYNYTTVPYMSNPIFVVDVQQLADTNRTRLQLLRHDLLRFLGLLEDASSQNGKTKIVNDQLLKDNEENVLPLPIIHERPGYKKKGSLEGADSTFQTQKKKFDICNTTYDKVRRDLLRISQVNSEYLRRHFLSGINDDGRNEQDVYVSSKEYLIHDILQKQWMYDPCTGKATVG